MPVVVTGASGLVGRPLVRHLAGSASEVRAVVRDRTKGEPLRTLGAKVATSRIDDVETLATVMTGAHTVCHLVGGLNVADEEYDRLNRGTVESVLEAALEAGVARFLFLSYPGASADSPNPYLRAKGAAEDLVRGSGLEHAIVRATHVYGPGSRWLEEMRQAARRAVAVVIGPGTQRLAPVFVDDVARTLAAADDRGAEVRGTFGLQGADELSADELVDLLAGRRRRKVRVRPSAAERLVRITGRRMSRAMLDVLAEDSLADAADAAAEFGVELTPLSRGLAANGSGPGAQA